MEGIVKFFREDKAFGFITSDDGKEYFVHISGVDNNEILKKGQKVRFDVENGDRGDKAIRVQVL